MNFSALTSVFVLRRPPEHSEGPPHFLPELSTAVGAALAFIFMMLSLHAQSPLSGKVVGNVYTNASLHLVYEWPKQYTVVDVFRDKFPKQSAFEFGLIAVKSPDCPCGMITMAERISTQPDGERGIRSPGSFLDRIPPGWDPQSPGTGVKRSRVTGSHQLVFEELDYMQGPDLNAALVTQIGDYLIVTRCNASTKAQLEEMKRAVLGMKVFPDGQ